MDFTTYCVSNPTEKPDPDDWVDRWHNGECPDGQKLHEYLGLTWSEYGMFVKDPDYIWKVVAARKLSSTL
jgi:hypothetical protein